MKYKFGNAYKARKAYYAALNYYIEYKHNCRDLCNENDDIYATHISGDMLLDRFKVYFKNGYKIIVYIANDTELNLIIVLPFSEITSKNEYLIIDQARRIFGAACCEGLDQNSTLEFDMDFFVGGKYENEKTAE